MQLPTISLQSLGNAISKIPGRTPTPTAEPPPLAAEVAAEPLISPPSVAHNSPATFAPLHLDAQRPFYPPSVPECSKIIHLLPSVELPYTKPDENAPDGLDFSPASVRTDVTGITNYKEPIPSEQGCEDERGYLYYPERDLPNLPYLTRLAARYPALAVALASTHRVVLSPLAARQLREFGPPAACLVDAGTGKEGAKGAALWSEVVGEKHRRFDRLC